MENLTRNYLEKLGITVSTNNETGIDEIQKIDEVESWAMEQYLPYIPPQLKSDADALDIVYNISQVTLEDDKINSEMREIIIEDCVDLLSKF